MGEGFLVRIAAPSHIINKSHPGGKKAFTPIERKRKPGSPDSLFLSRYSCQSFLYRIIKSQK